MLKDEVMNYDSVLDFVRNVVRYDIPKHKFAPCGKCKETVCYRCEKFEKHQEFIKDNPILDYEQQAIEFINKLKKICEY